jgi:hypothetical protein
MRKIIILPLIILLSCNTIYDAEKPIIELNYGRIKEIYEKSATVRFDSTLSINPEILDSSSISYINKYFNKKGNITKADYFYPDSTIAITLKYNNSIFNNEIVAKEYDGNGALKAIIKIIKETSDSIVTVKIDPETEEVLEETRSFIRNELIVTQETYDFRTNDIDKFEFIRDSSGRTIKNLWSGRGNGKDFQSDTVLRKYLEFDNEGNWIRRIRYVNDEKNECYLSSRTLNYYKE